MDRSCNVLRAGLTDYDDCLRLQHMLLARRQEGRVRDTLIITEHRPVITFGRGFREELPDIPLPAYAVERGGSATYHGPGQFVAYPVLNIIENDLTVRMFVSKVLESAVLSLADYGIRSEYHLENTGVWCADRKIASLGMAVKGWVSFHGIAINLTNDLTPFRLIQPCGMNPLIMTNAERISGRCIPMEEFSEVFVGHFMRLFNMKPSYITAEEIGADELLNAPRPVIIAKH